jgi:hypothetical protein
MHKISDGLLLSGRVWDLPYTRPTRAGIAGGRPRNEERESSFPLDTQKPKISPSHSLFPFPANNAMAVVVHTCGGRRPAGLNLNFFETRWPATGFLLVFGLFLSFWAFTRTACCFYVQIMQRSLVWNLHLGQQRPQRVRSLVWPHFLPVFCRTNSTPFAFVFERRVVQHNRACLNAVVAMMADIPTLVTWMFRLTIHRESVKSRLIIITVRSPSNFRWMRFSWSASFTFCFGLFHRFG